ncbi:unnamed protein product [Calicophoron daubneyi]|uniref:Band 7 domain-containing protein n=1 Tax=Calicophoron daubneyi TaxID=300641 RepID=A0AAV2TR29_CALDB
MASNSTDADDECFVIPAVTKRYSQVTLPNQAESGTETQAQGLSLPTSPPKIGEKSSLKSTLKSQPLSDSVGKSQHSQGSQLLGQERLNCHKPGGCTTSGGRKTAIGKNSEKRRGSHYHAIEPITETSLLSVGSKSMSKRTSIQQLRKYSVVDPNSLKYFEENTKDTREFGVCSALLITISYLIIILTFPLSLFICIKVVAEYERAVIFRLGRILPRGARGPGLFFIAPCIDSIRKVDLRTVTFDVPPQEVLTKDSVTVAVDAVVYYRIYNPVVAITNVEDADRSTRLLAATTLRNVLGTRNLAEILSERESISISMQAMLDDATDPWGVKVERVEVKDVRLPVQLQRAMAAEAEATREARAKVIAAEGEEKSSFALKQAADVIRSSPFALHLRYLQTLSAISAEKNSTIIFPLPMDMLVNLFQRS